MLSRKKKLAAMEDELASQPLTVLPFDWKQWHALWELRLYQLAEYGIIVPPAEIPGEPQDVSRDDHEWDYHHIADVFLRGVGGFWLAWWEYLPVGHIAGQDFGGAIELRHMYVRAEYRRHGIGSCLVLALLDHCQCHSIKAVELWTGGEGPGRRLYERIGFKITSKPGLEYSDLLLQTNYVPGKDEIRMRLDLE